MSEAGNHLEELPEEVGCSGELELLYGNSLLQSKVTLEELERMKMEEEKAPERPESPPPTPPLQSEMCTRDRRSLRQALQEALWKNQDRYGEEEKGDTALQRPPVDYFSKTNPDCFNLNGQPLAQVRRRPPREGDAPRRPHVFLDWDFDSPSESEDDVEAPQVAKVDVPAVSQAPEMPKASKAQARVTQASEEVLALPSPWPCHLGPYCCLDHCRSLAGHCSTLLQSLGLSRRRGVWRLQGEDEAVEKLCQVREEQLARHTVYQTSLRSRQRAS